MQLEARPHVEDLTESELRVQRVLTNGAFVGRMLRAISKGRESAIPGTFVDLTPPIGAKRYQPEPSRSPCGSSAAMCLLAGGET